MHADSTFIVRPASITVKITPGLLELSHFSSKEEVVKEVLSAEHLSDPAIGVCTGRTYDVHSTDIEVRLAYRSVGNDGDFRVKAIEKVEQLSGALGLRVEASIWTETAGNHSHISG